MSKKPIDNKGFTTLPWAEYRVKAGEIWNSIPAGQPKKKIVEEALGVGRWPDKDGNLIEYTLKSNKDRKENFQRQPVKTRKKNQEAFTKKRKSDLTATNELAKQEDLDAGKIKQKQIQSVTGRNADHIIEVQTFGPATEQLNKEYKAGAISEEEYLKRKNILSNTGDTAQNFQDLSVIENQNKKDIVEAKNKALKKMEELNPSLRHLTDKYQTAMQIAERYKVTKLAKKTTKLLPYLGTAIVLNNLNGRVHAATQKPTAKNIGLAGLAAADAVLEGVEYATGGLALPITTLLQAGIIGAETVIEDGTAKISTANRRRYRHGNR